MNDTVLCIIDTWTEFEGGWDHANGGTIHLSFASYKQFCKVYRRLKMKSTKMNKTLNRWDGTPRAYDIPAAVASIIREHMQREGGDSETPYLAHGMFLTNAEVKTLVSGKNPFTKIKVA